MNLNPVPLKNLEILVLGAAPERKVDLEDLWTKYKPECFIYDDNSGIPVRAKGARIEFTNRAMRLFWLLSFTGWKIFRCYGPAMVWGLMSGQRPADLVGQDNGFDEAQALFEQLLYAASHLR